MKIIANIFIIIGIISLIIGGLGRLGILRFCSRVPTPGTLMDFAGICALFAIALALQKLTCKKE